MLIQKKNFLTVVCMALFSVILASDAENSNPWYGNSYNDAELQQIKENQKKLEGEIQVLNKKLDQVLKSIEELKNTKPTQANNNKNNNKKKGADPNYAHNIPQGDSFFIGNPNGKVVITEFFDFQ